VVHSYSKKMLYGGDQPIQKEEDWMPSNETQDDGAAEALQEATEVAAAASSQRI
jgi:hypothetical protein